MTCTTRIGTVLTRTGTNLPAGLQVETKGYLPGWEMVTDSDGSGLDAKIRKTGWSFFFLAATLHTTVWGSWNEATLRKALNRVVNQLKRSRFNSLEITAIAGKRFLGLPYLQLSANSRQMQEEMSL
jgi:hypothetical protein